MPASPRSRPAPQPICALHPDPAPRCARAPPLRPRPRPPRPGARAGPEPGEERLSRAGGEWGARRALRGLARRVGWREAGRGGRPRERRGAPGETESRAGSPSGLGLALGCRRPRWNYVLSGEVAGLAGCGPCTPVTQKRLCAPFALDSTTHSGILETPTPAHP